MSQHARRDEVTRIQRTFAEGHDYIWACLPFLVPMAAKLAKACCGSGPECARLGEIVAELRSVLLDHLAHDERTLAAMSDQRDPALTRACIAEMHREHGMIKELLERARAAAGLPGVASADACPTERAFLRQLALLHDHVREQIWVEDQVLAPRLTVESRNPE
jgi:iron-sulfur cluster repair protein YtfE (RIC family)